ncbi:DNA excision repair protein ERCC-6-like [Dunckerocampus dactyliophorus]|uniref:DNA excision repair protein ERCC-6-like n=1 Tax=Dunckerocampus dactyliophorus TaxID=161453 RepID=UPI002406F4D9|nr:DNA excision repair protein ERCC-6-like [Dunckerocampus dactyliophorus]
MNGGCLHGDVDEINKKMEKCLSMDQKDTMEGYHRYIQQGKDVARQGDLSRALELFKMANKIQHSEKLQKRIKKIEELLAQNTSEEDDADQFVDVNNSGLKLYKDLYQKLYDYQRDGVAFLFGLYRDGKKGGILADDMGLGKTIQVISFLSGMYDSELVKHTLLVMPTSLISNWTKEFAKWTPGMRVKEFHGSSKAERTRNLEKVQSRSGVVITTYTMLINNWQLLSSYQGREFTWDYVILDEAHKIKTSTTKTAKSASAVPSKHRVLLTGTPVQNHLREMWALFDFACHGTLLGTAKTFKMQYENPITRAREKDATPGEKALGSRMSENLMTIIKPYFLRRTKSEVQQNKNAEAGQGKVQGAKGARDQKDSGTTMPTLMRKNDLIVWTYLSRIQEDIYWKFISLDHIKELLMTSRSPLAELTLLKKLCDHPRLLSARAIASLGLKDSPTKRQQSDDAAMSNHTIANVPDKTLISESGKLVFLFALLERLKEEGHRTLVFAHYRMVLDIIERILKNRGVKALRLDGSITQVAERERLITLFQADHTYSVFLLTTQVGGVGITLTGADRVVIYDPSWNPMTDAQAVDRAYRIGQTANVVIYRLITCGTVEEKIYRRQVFKDSLIRQNTGDKKNPFRYFSKQELKELFTLEDTRSSSTQQLLQSMHSKHRHTDPELDRHIARLHTMEMFGISDHDLMFSLNTDHEDSLHDKAEQNYIEDRVQKAQELVKAESDLQMQFATSVESTTEPAWIRQQGSDRKERSHENKPVKPRPRSALSPRPRTTSSKNDDLQERNSPIDLTVSDDESEGKQENLQEKVDRSAEDMFGSLSLKEGIGHEEHDEANDLGESFPIKRLSAMQSSSSSFKMDSWSRGSAGSDLIEGNFNLQLEESEISYQGAVEDEERKLLSHLQTEGMFDVDISLTERQQTEALGQSLSKSQVSEIDESIIIVAKKKKAGVLYDSDEEPGDRPKSTSSFQLLGSSTPKSGPPGSTPVRLRKSIGRNTSVASRHSLLHSIIEDLDKPDDQDEDHPEELSEKYSDEVEVEVEEEEEEEDEEDGNPEESTGELELASSERMEPCAANTAPGQVTADSSGDMYESLVTRGHEFFSQGKLNEALDSFLKAIDINPGDPEIQCLTIQLYRQLSCKE